jgi:hypothetical protein
MVALSLMKEPQYPLDCRLDGLQSLSGQGGEEKNLLPLPEIESHVLGHPAHTILIY